MEIIHKYFENLNNSQIDKFVQLQDLYAHWNEQINVISRKDLDALYERHVLHSLAIAKFIQFSEGTQILDIGTGGGFPGIPLAIYFPDVQFHLVDSIGKKIKVVTEVAKALNLNNVRAEHARAEKIKGEYDFIVSRAVTRMNNFLRFTHNKIKTENNHSLPNGIIALKGGDLKEELGEIKRKSQTYKLSNFFEEEFFETKQIVHVAL